MRILVVEDFSPLRTAVTRGLTEAGYAVDAVGDGDEGLSFAETGVYDVIVLDILLPGTNGFDVVRRLRDKECPSRILLLTAKDSVDDRVQGLDLGADDYLVKPFAFQELLARVRALVRRRYDEESPTIRVGSFELDTAAKTARRDGDPIDLTAREYSILETLAVRRGRVVTRSEIEDRIYDFDQERTSNVVDVYIGYLRKKIERDHLPRILHTRRGLGYVLREDP